MGEREFLIYLDPKTRQVRYRHYHVWQGSQIVEFRIQLEILVAGVWYAVVRYDTAHGRPHRDLLRPSGRETKEWYDELSFADVLTFGQKDIMENWPVYRARFLKELNYE
jgi:hypothetical protein